MRANTFALIVGAALVIHDPVAGNDTTTKEEPELVELARQKFGRLTQAEEKLFRAVANGEVADFSAESDEENDPAKAEKWGEERLLKADRIAWLCTDPKASALVAHIGVAVRGARVDGNLDLLLATIPFSLSFQRSALPDWISLQHAGIVLLSLDGTCAHAIMADGLRVERDVFLRNGFRAEGEVRLTGARIGGTLDCDRACFVNPGGSAIHADGIDVGGGVFLRDGFSAEGGTRLIGGIISGNLECDQGRFVNPKGYALDAEGLQVAGSVSLRNVRAEGEVRLTGATIRGQLHCDNGRFLNQGGNAFTAHSMEVRGNVFLRSGFTAQGQVSLAGGVIGGNLGCENGLFVNPDRHALLADGLRIDGGLFLNGAFESRGEVRLLGAKIGGNLQCSGGRFFNPNGYALNGDGLKVGGAVLLNHGFRADGEVSLAGAALSVRLGCNNGSFINPNRNALNAEGIGIEGSLLLRDGFRADGAVDLTGATIHGHFALTGVASPGNMALDLRSATVGTLLDDPESWPQKPNLLLDGFVYRHIHQESPTRADLRLDWLRRQRTKPFKPQPYEQLAEVLRKGGNEEDARQILIAKENDRARYTQMGFLERCWHCIFGLSIAYGHRPFRAFKIGLVVIAVGWGLFFVARRKGLITATKKEEFASKGTDDGQPYYPKFCALVYSLDMFVPVINLHQASYWLPNANRGKELLRLKWFNLRCGGLFRLYLWIHLILGWVLTTLFVVGLTGLIRS